MVYQFFNWYNSFFLRGFFKLFRKVAVNQRIGLGLLQNKHLKKLSVPLLKQFCCNYSGFGVS